MSRVAGRTRGGDNLRGGESGSGPEPDRVERRLRTMLRWRPGVRFVLILLVLFPMVSAGFLVGSRVASGSAFREQAQLVAGNAARLEEVAVARAQLNALVVPIRAVSFAAGMGINTAVL